MLDQPVDSHALLWIMILVPLLLIIASVALLIIRRKFKSEPEDFNQNAVPFTLDQLRQMQDQGQLSEEEFLRLKNKIIQETNLDSSDS